MRNIKAAGENDLYILVDDEDFEYLNQWKWSITQAGYALRAYRIKGKLVNIYMHRLLINAPKGKFVDHINHNRSDNQRANLRLCTSYQNSLNHKLKSNSLAGIKGVSVNKRLRYKKYVATLKYSINGQTKRLTKYCSSLEEASVTYNQWAEKYHREYAYLSEVT